MSRYWQQCDMPDCPNEVRTSTAICDSCALGSQAATEEESDR